MEDEMEKFREDVAAIGATSQMVSARGEANRWLHATLFRVILFFFPKLIFSKSKALHCHTLKSTLSDRSWRDLPHNANLGVKGPAVIEKNDHRERCTLRCARWCKYYYKSVRVQLFGSRMDPAALLLPTFSTTGLMLALFLLPLSVFPSCLREGSDTNFLTHNRDGLPICSSLYIENVWCERSCYLCYPPPAHADSQHGSTIPSLKKCTVTLLLAREVAAALTSLPAPRKVTAHRRVPGMVKRCRR